MAKYHINSKGEPGLCRAEAGGCPFGGEAVHYPTKENAQKAYELSNAAQAMPEAASKEPAPIKSPHVMRKGRQLRPTEAIEQESQRLRGTYVQPTTLPAADAERLFGRGGVMPYRVIFSLIVFVGCTVPLAVVWNFSDVMNGLMALPNLIGLVLCAGLIARETRQYLAVDPDLSNPPRKYSPGGSC